MKFETVHDLIEYLKQFNPNAKLLTDMGFSWAKHMCSDESEDTRLTTNILYVYGDYNPYYEENQNFYRIKDFIIHNYFDEYDLVSCFICFEDEDGNPAVEYYLKHKNYWSFKKVNEVHKNILKGLYKFCHENNYIDEWETLSIFIVQEKFD